MVWRSQKQMDGNYSPVGARSLLIFKYLDAWGEAHSTNDIIKANAAVTVLETYLAPYLRDYWKWDAEKGETPKITQLKELAAVEAEEQLRETYAIAPSAKLENIFENESRKDKYNELLALSFSKWRAVFLTRVIEDNQLLGGGKDAVTMEGFDTEETPTPDIQESFEGTYF